MANYSFTSQLSGTETAAVVGIASTQQAQATATTPWSPSVSRGDISINTHTSLNPGNLVLSTTGSIGVSTESLSKESTPGWLTGRRPQKGQLYPRGVFNK